MPKSCINESPQLRKPSDAVHGRSKAKRKTFSAAMTKADGITGQGWPKTISFCFCRPQVPWLNSPCRCSDSRLSDYGLPAGTLERTLADSIVSKSARPFSPIHSLGPTARPTISPFRPIRITVGLPVTRYNWLTAPLESTRTTAQVQRPTECGPPQCSREYTLEAQAPTS